MKQIFVFLLLAILMDLVFANPLSAAEKASSVSLNPEAISAKSFLEGLLVRRYSLELSTMVERDSFSLGAQVDVSPNSPVKTEVAPSVDTTYNDLMLGTLDADQLLTTAQTAADERSFAQKLVENYRVRSVLISVGLKDELNAQVKAEVEQWLTKRLQSEFGKAGKHVVQVIKRIPDKKPQLDLQNPPQTMWEWVDRYQSFAGQALLGAAIVIGIVLWQFLSKLLGVGGNAGAGNGMGAEPMAAGSSEESSDFASLAEAAKELQAEQDLQAKKDADHNEREIVRSGRDAESLKARLRELAPRLQNYMEEIIRQWCMMGDAGRLRLACFAEAAGRETGKLPIPVDALSEVQKVFARMSEISYNEKREALEKAYWDLLSTLNLGSESLSQPFSYIDGMNLGMINKVLIDQNPKLKTLVSLYMNKDMRSRYLKALSPQAKKELLMQAAEMSEIRADELETLDRGLMGRINPTVGQEVVPLEMSFNKIVDGLSVIEEVTLLADMKSPAIEQFKRNFASLAFLHEWPDDKLQLLLIGITPDELISYLRVRPDMQERMIGMASMMVKEIATEELAKPDRLSTMDKEKAIEFFTTRIRGLVSGNDIRLEEVFGPIPGEGLHILDGGAGDEKRVA